MIPKKALRFISGEKLGDAISRIKFLNKTGINGIVDHVGEEIKSKKEVEKAVSEYEKLITAIKKQKLKATVDVKLTNLGLCIDKRYCLENLRKVLRHAKGTKVWIDAEQYKYRKATTEIFLIVNSEFSNVYLTVQAYFKDSLTYLNKVIKGKVRLVKGTYRENPKISYKTREDIRKQFLKLMRQLFLKSNDFGIATHDKPLVRKALELEKKYKKKVEFQFLMGLAHEFKVKIKKIGYPVGEYIPYGTQWQGYYKRRLDYLKSKH